MFNLARHHRALLLVSVFLALPLVFQATTTGTSFLGMFAGDGIDIRGMRNARLNERARYGKVLERYEDLIQEGKTGLIVPNINDTDTWKPYLVVAPSSVQRQLLRIEPMALGKVTPAGRLALKNAERSGYCAESLRVVYSPEFYELCRKQVGKKLKMVSPKGLTNEFQNARAGDRTPDTTVNARIKQVEQGYLNVRMHGAATTSKGK